MFECSKMREGKWSASIASYQSVNVITKFGISFCCFSQMRWWLRMTSYQHLFFLLWRLKSPTGMLSILLIEKICNFYKNELFCALKVLTNKWHESYGKKELLLRHLDDVGSSFTSKSFVSHSIGLFLFNQSTLYNHLSVFLFAGLYLYIFWLLFYRLTNLSYMQNFHFSRSKNDEFQ